MSDLTFNKYAGAVLATGFTIAILVQAAGFAFPQEKVAGPRYFWSEPAVMIDGARVPSATSRATLRQIVPI